MHRQLRLLFPPAPVAYVWNRCSDCGHYTKVPVPSYSKVYFNQRIKCADCKAKHAKNV